MEIWVTILIQVHSIINLSLKEDKINPIGQFAKFVVKMVIQQLIAIIGWTSYIRENMLLLSQLQWQLTFHKCSLAMVGLLILNAQIMLLPIYLSCHYISNQFRATRQLLQAMDKSFLSLLWVMVSFKLLLIILGLIIYLDFLILHPISCLFINCVFKIMLFVILMLRISQFKICLRGGSSTKG